MDSMAGGDDEPKAAATSALNNAVERPDDNSVTVANEGGQSNVAVVVSNNNMNSNNDQIHRRPSTRTPFTNLSQVDADLALARTLQEQERAYMMVRMNGDGSDYGSWEAGNYVHEEDDDFEDPSEEEDDDGTDADDNIDENNEDVFDVHAHAEAREDDNPAIELDPSVYSSDEAYARALQDSEEQEVAARLMFLAGINERSAQNVEDHGGNSQDIWEEVDPDEFSYEELIALSEVVGTESRGLSADKIASLPLVSYKAQSTQEGSNDSCVICRLDYEDGDTLTELSCKHSYHSECINNWLQIKKLINSEQECLDSTITAAVIRISEAIIITNICSDIPCNEQNICR